MSNSLFRSASLNGVLIATLLAGAAPLTAWAQSEPLPGQFIGPADCKVFNPHPVPNESISWSGGCKDGYAEGSGILLWHVDGKEDSRYEGGMQRGRKHGPSAQQDHDGTITWGAFVEGKRHGNTRVERENAYTLDGVYDHGKLSGNVTVGYVSGNRYVGQWGPCGPEGDGTMEYATGGSYSGGWKDGLPYHHGTVTYPNGIRREAQFNVSVAADDKAPQQNRRVYNVAGDVNSLYRFEPLATGGAVPFNRGYRDLSPDDQRHVRGWFHVLNDDDVPPYPVGGTAAIVKAISASRRAYHELGMLWLDVLIDEDGVAQNVAIRRTPGKDIGEFAAQVLLLSKYTPARCGSQPCAMRFPLRFDLTP